MSLEKRGIHAVPIMYLCTKNSDEYYHTTVFKAGQKGHTRKNEKITKKLNYIKSSYVPKCYNTCNSYTADTR